jgi:hypothetical protein
MHASQIHFVFPLTQNVVEKFFAVHDNMVYNSGVVVRGCGHP